MDALIYKKVKPRKNDKHKIQKDGYLGQRKPIEWNSRKTILLN